MCFNFGRECNLYTDWGMVRPSNGAYLRVRRSLEEGFVRQNNINTGIVIVDH